MIITVDYDGTLSRADVQEYVKKLIANGIDVWILTGRFDELHKHIHPYVKNNEDLYEVVEKLGIPRHKIIFMNMNSKGCFLINTKVRLHFENDLIEIEDIHFDTHTLCVNVNNSDWKEYADFRIKEFRNAE